MIVCVRVVNFLLTNSFVLLQNKTIMIIISILLQKCISIFVFVLLLLALLSVVDSTL